MNNRTIKSLALCSTALLAVAYAPAVSAQDVAAEEVVVTGSRVITNGFAQPTPVTVVTQEQMQMTAPSSLSDAINQLPQFKSSFVAASTGFGAGAGAGGSFLNLRGLGITRNLTLIDGQRIVNTGFNGSSAGAVDTNMLPQQLVRRVDVVTGGASAAYGSDALSGVVNFVLDSKFTGIKGEVRGAITSRGDNQRGGISLAVGRPFAGGRGHVVASAEYVAMDGLDFSDREWARSDRTTMANVACPTPQTSTACPTRIITGPTMPSNMSSGGLIIGGATALRGRYFAGDAAVLTPFPYGTNLTYPAGSPTPTQTVMVGGGLPQDRNLGLLLNNVPGNKRGNAFLRAGWDLTPDWNVWASAMYGTAKSNYPGIIGSPPSYGNLLVFEDNAYLNATTRAAIGGAGATRQNLVNPATGLLTGPSTAFITLGRIGTDWPMTRNHNITSMLRLATGIDGKFKFAGTDWTASAYYTRGVSHRKTGVTDTLRVSNLHQSIDAVASPGGAGLPAAGTPICRTTIAFPTNGCVPINIMGERALTAAQVSWLESGSANGSSFLTQSTKQDAVEFNLRGEPISTWAGPVSVGFGAAYRREATEGVADTISESYIGATPGALGYVAGVTPILTYNLPLSGSTITRGSRAGWAAGNQGGFGPVSLDVKEVYGEALVPLLADHSFATNLDLNGAVRYADYQYGGGQLNWKVGIVYRLKDLRIRATQSKDIRAPNLGNLFAGGAVSNAAVTDPFRRGTTGNSESNPNAVTLSQGNPALKPERGDTFTIGLVYQPTWNTWVEGLSFSFDYYNIIVTNAIGTVGAVNACFNGETYYCQFIDRNSDPSSFGAGNTIGPIVQIFNRPVNTGGTKNTGLDIEVSYRLPLSKIWDGRSDILTARVLMNAMRKNCGIPTGAATSISCTVGNNSGSFVGGSGGNSDWAGSANLNYTNGGLTINWQTRFINKGRLNANVDFDGNPYPANILVNPNTTGNGQVPNTVPSYFYSDLSISYKFGPDRRYEGFLTINNLFDKDPPQIGTMAFFGVYPANGSLYDTIGRNFTGGFRFRF